MSDRRRGYGRNYVTIIVRYCISDDGGRERKRERDGHRRVDNRERELITVTSINMYNACHGDHERVDVCYGWQRT